MAVTTSQRVPKHLFSSPCLPYQPPSLLEAYEVARLEGHCLQPEANLKNRLMSCTTGMSFCHPLLEGNEAPLGTLLTSNSLGDIFLRTLTKREDDQQPDVRGNENSNEMLAEYAKKLVEQKRVLNYTEIKNMKGMRKIFLCKYLNSDVKQDMEAMDDSFSENEQPAQEIPARTTPVKKKRKRLHLGRWQKSFRALHSYKDALVPDLLSIWDIDMEDEKDDVNLGNLQSNLLVKPDPDKKVQCWLETNHNTSTAMVVIPRTNASIPGHDVSNITAEAENSLLFNQTQDTIDFDNVIQSTQIADVNITQTINTSNIEELPLNTTTNSLDRSKTKKKAKKYVKGF